MAAATENAARAVAAAANEGAARLWRLRWIAARAVAAAANAGAARLWRLRRRTQRGLSPLLRMKAQLACGGCDGGCSTGCRRCCE